MKALVAAIAAALRLSVRKYSSTGTLVPLACRADSARLAKPPQMQLDL